MKLVLAGLPTRDAAAAEVFVRKNFKGWDCLTVAEPRGAGLPAADLYLIDLAGAALSRWSEEGEATVRAWLERAPAVLVVPAFDTSWSVLGEAAGLPCVQVGKPYRTDDLRDALTRASRLRVPDRKTESPVVTPPAAAPSPPAALAAAAVPTVAPTAQTVRPVVAPVAVLPRAAAAPAPAALPARVPVAPGLDVAAFAQAVAASSSSAGPRFLRRLVEALDGSEAFEVRFTVQNSLIVHPRDAWVASNTPMGVILRVCGSEALASVVSIRALAEDEAQMRAHRLGMPIAPLGPFLGDLASAALPSPGATPAAA